MSEPRCVEVSAGVSISGKVQIVQYEYFEDYFFSQSRRYEIPEDWTDKQVDEFYAEKTAELHTQVDEEFASPAVELLMEKRDRIEREQS